MPCYRRARALLRGLRAVVGCLWSWPANARSEASFGTPERRSEQSPQSTTLWQQTEEAAPNLNIVDQELTEVRAPRPCEAVVVSGPGLAIGLRKALRGNAHLDFPGFHATLDRLDAIWEPIATHVAPVYALFGPDGPIPDGLDWCLPDTGVALSTPNAEGILAYLDAAGMTNVHIVVERRFVELIEDPGSSWPWDDKERTELTTKLGLSTCT